MTIATTTSRVVAQGNGATTAFSYNFLIPTADDAVVTFTDAGGNSTELGASQYTISGFGNPAGGTVTYPVSGSPMTTGQSLSVQRLLPLKQLTKLTNQGGYYPDVVEDALDALEMQIQQLAESLARALVMPPSDALTVSSTLPTVPLRALMLLSFDDNGNVIAVAPAAQSATALAIILASTEGPANIGFIQSGFGSQARLLQDKTRERLSPEDKGAVADGATDNHTALVAALGDKRRLEFASGVYVDATGHLSPTNSQSLRGQGRESTYLRTSHATAPVYSSTATFVTVSDMTVDRVTPSTTAGVGVQAVGTSNSVVLEGFKAERVNCNGHGTGLALYDFVLANISDCYLQNGGTGLFTDKTGSAYCTMLTISRCWLRGNTVAGATVNNVENSVFDQVAFEGSGVHTPVGLTIAGGTSHNLNMCWWEGLQQATAFSSCGSAHVDGGFLNGSVLAHPAFYAFGSAVIFDGSWGVQNLTQAFAQADTGAKIVVRSPDLAAFTFQGVNGGYVVWEVAKTVALVDAASVSVDASAGNYLTLTGTTGRTIAAPANAGDGQEITFEFENTSGGSITHTFATGAGAYRAAGNVAIAAAKVMTVRFRFNTTRNLWIEVARSASAL